MNIISKPALTSVSVESVEPVVGAKWGVGVASVGGGVSKSMGEGGDEAFGVSLRLSCISYEKS